ncbi:kinase-like domain-containing protein [Daldinia vernicosa]|uniref:kinase-like domain-containing protein n=1 Tax=Daldinia vernicosa TaxID=114800 RepID=UPI002007F232|nr:kinase-like domain-containing protein [Daldinia vernicosa]KAI0843961.1 kinase-like domain-containing protein [Daldinia vernicosa]
MDIPDDLVSSTLSLIESTRLPHPSGPLLESFISEALNPVLAARYVNHRLQLGEASSLIDDWSYIIESITQNGRPPPRPSAVDQHAITRRDGGKCCVTGKAGTLRDPLVVAPILPIPLGWATDKASIIDMLGAFFGPPYRDWWLSYVRNPEGMPPYYNHWLVRKSAAKAFASGFVKLDRLHPSMIEYEFKHVPIGPEELIEVDGAYPLLGDHSRAGIIKVDPRFVGSQARLCKSIQYLNIYRNFSLVTPPRPSSLSIGLSAQRSNIASSDRGSLFNLCVRAFLTVWHLAPSKVRICCYKVLQKLGERLYGRPIGHSTVQRLPFGLYLKYNGEADDFRNEFNALKLVRQHTSIPVPEPLDVIVEQGDTNDPFSGPIPYLLMKRVPGLPLSRCQNVLSDRDIERIVNQLKDYVAQLRDIPRLTRLGMAICNTLGEACRDPRIQGANPVGPFADEAAFSQMLRFSDEPARRGHKIVFTHADLNPRNILVDQTVQSDGSIGWNVTGIVDWETAGYYPEYWDYTKALFEGFRWTRRYNDLVHNIFSEFGDYSRELDVEKRSWESGDGV